jgi:DNA (cytosine-5)-methyltransferase 1
LGRESRTSIREELAREESHGQSDNRSTDGSAEERARSWWDVEPNVGRVAYGIPSRVDRLKGLGNAIVPQIAMQIGLAIKEAMNDI